MMLIGSFTRLSMDSMGFRSCSKENSSFSTFSLVSISRMAQRYCIKSVIKVGILIGISASWPSAVVRKNPMPSIAPRPISSFFSFIISVSLPVIFDRVLPFGPLSPENTFCIYVHHFAVHTPESALPGISPADKRSLFSSSFRPERRSWNLRSKTGPRSPRHS